ncbi:MAG: thioesterase family protein [Desulfobacteraceae bacterium]|jgi:YbgC/YbaW family acyl-CoA thioester hydrolase
MKNDKFSIPLTVRSSDLNYGNHVGYQNYFSYFQEARIAYLNRLGYSELDIEGYGMIVGEANCKYKQELFLNDSIQVTCRTNSIKSKRFVMEYRIFRGDSICAEGFTTNYCYDYQAKTVVRLPAAFVQAVSAFEGWT